MYIFIFLNEFIYFFIIVTKDEVKLKNISEAIEVFENWIDDKKKSVGTDDKKKSSSKSEKKSSSSAEDDTDQKRKDTDTKGKEDNSSDTVPGLGFKDKEKALETIKLLDGRDPDYQKLAVKGLIGRAKRVLTCTKDKDKLQNIKNAVEVFEKFLDNFEKLNLSKANMTYLPLSVIESCMCLVEHYDMNLSKEKSFFEVYKSVEGQYKKLRTQEDTETQLSWDIIRNKELKSLKKKLGDVDLFEDDGNPTKDHLKMILWAYSPQEQRMKKIKIIPPNGDIEMKDENSSNGNKQKDDRKSGNNKKRKHSSSGSSNDDDSPTKKAK
ncbi:uracil-DNA degrading factor isoform X2 [Arctopsyche grandis]|uniref:uracil-DNA degrading factor isoform X2 n=1 Tax=Arctopsyche grandis TaxID=121162 RepID=UPI00406D984E